MKKLLCLALGVSVPFVCVTLVLMALPVPPQTTITRVNFDRVQPGMTFQEVEAILGPFNGSTKNAQGGWAIWFRGGTGYNNTDDEGAADIKFDADDRVIEAKWTENPDFEPQDWFERVSLHYGLARFHWDRIAVLFSVIFAVVALIAVAFRTHKLGRWQASRNDASTADRSS
jgi:hypothetical protein